MAKLSLMLRRWLGRRLDRHGALAVPVAAVLSWSIGVGVTEQGPGTGPLPPFHEIEQVSVKKQRFFEYLTPVIRAENERIREQRARLLEISEAVDAGESPGWMARRFLDRLAREYRVDAESLDTSELIDALVERVDVIPRSLVLVQAAKESGWGSSRFARRANNLFGQWCFDPGCGVVPSNRPEGRIHEVQSFDTVRDAVASYVRNLNTHRSYEPLREVRAELRAADQPLRGTELARGLGRYSERGDAYVREVQSMIRQNELEGGSAGG